jgi:hypothetical protein
MANPVPIVGALRLISEVLRHALEPVLELYLVLRDRFSNPSVSICAVEYEQAHEQAHEQAEAERAEGHPGVPFGRICWLCDIHCRLREDFLRDMFGCAGFDRVAV